MREVRPTIRVMRALPKESFIDEAPWFAVKNKKYETLELYGIQHPLLEDARRQFESGVRSRHTKASAAAGRSVFEVRDRQGAAWRGAVVIDEDGDPWLVYVDKHDAFHSSVEGAFRNGGLDPGPAEYKLRDREEQIVSRRAWQVNLLTALSGAITTAARDGGEVTITADGYEAPDSASLSIEVESDAPSETVAQAHESEAMIAVTLTVRARSRNEFVQEILHLALPFIQPDAAQYEPIFTKSGDLLVLVTVPQSKLIQLTAALSDTETPRRGSADPPTHLHYVGIEFMTDAFVQGHAIRAVCGAWFVQTRDDSADLPVCPTCDDEMPAAEAVLAVLRRRVAD